MSGWCRMLGWCRTTTKLFWLRKFNNVGIMSDVGKMWTITKFFRLRKYKNVGMISDVEMMLVPPKVNKVHVGMMSDVRMMSECISKWGSKTVHHFILLRCSQIVSLCFCPYSASLNTHKSFCRITIQSLLKKELWVLWLHYIHLTCYVQILSSRCVQTLGHGK